MKFISTNKILLRYALNYDIDSEWISWAISMLESGYDTRSLRILAGEMPPYHQFILRDLAKKVFDELVLDTSNTKQLIKNYTRDLLRLMLSREIKSQIVLKELGDLYLDLDDPYQSILFDFYLLYYAQDDLKYSEIQYYVPNANRENIEHMIFQEANQWLEEYE